MLNMLKDIAGLSLAGGLDKYMRQYKDRRNIFDSSRVNCAVIGWSYPATRFKFFATCYCDDALVVPPISSRLTIFESTSFESRQEAEAAMDLQIVYASRKFKDSAFYRQRYYPESDAVGEALCCKNGQWSIEKNLLVYICPGCRTSYTDFPERKICNWCGEIIL